MRRAYQQMSFDTSSVAHVVDYTGDLLGALVNIFWEL